MISMKIGILRILMKPQYDICSFYFFLDNVCFQTTVQKSLAEDCFLRLILDLWMLVDLLPYLPKLALDE